jgi:SAM-dependent methyltransferase
VATEAVLEGHYVLGVEGLALLRAGAERRFERVEDRVREIARVAQLLDEGAYSERRDLPEHGVDTGYAGRAESYDDPGNDTVALEEPVVRALLDQMPAGPVLDAACGTGRHMAHLLAAGREVIGVDSSEAMLARAREKLPGADLRRGDLAALPLEDESVSGAVCALALSHLPDMGPAVAELARVLRPGGQIVISKPPSAGDRAAGLARGLRRRGGQTVDDPRAPAPSRRVPQRLHRRRSRGARLP